MPRVYEPGAGEKGEGMNDSNGIGSAAWYADKLVDWVAMVTQLDPEKDELPNVEDWRRNAEKLFGQAMDAADERARRGKK